VRKALLRLPDPRTLLLLISYKGYETAGSACRSTAILVALGKCSLWLRISVCVDITAFDRHATCCVSLHAVSRSFAFTPIAEVQSCAGCHLLFEGKWPCLIKTPSVFPPLFLYVAVWCHCWSEWLRRKGGASRCFGVVIFKYSLGDFS
jgi:hypothetical protein